RPEVRQIQIPPEYEACWALQRHLRRRRYPELQMPARKLDVHGFPESDSTRSREHRSHRRGARSTRQGAPDSAFPNENAETAATARGDELHVRPSRDRTRDLGSEPVDALDFRAEIERDGVRVPDRNQMKQLFSTVERGLELADGLRPSHVDDHGRCSAL